MNYIDKEKIAIISVLGRKDDDVYSNRILHGIKLAKDYICLFDSIHLIVKWYKDSKWSYDTIKNLVSELNSNKVVLHNDKETEYYRRGIYSFDTIEEAAMLRLSIEKLFKNKEVYLTIVTSEVHSVRSNFIFKSLFENNIIKENLKSIVIPYNPSPFLSYINYSDNSTKEIKEESYIKEKNIINKIMNEVENFNNFLKFYEGRNISFKGAVDWSGKKELLIHFDKNNV